MNELISNIVNALSLGGLYALFALGIALIFGIMGLINFAHGELIMLGGYVLALVTLPFSLLVPLTIATVVLAALLTERFAFRPLRGAPMETLLISSFAVSYLLQNLVILTIGPDAESATMPAFFSRQFTVGSVTFPAQQVITLVVVAVALIGLVLFLNFTHLGIAMRATSEDFVMARILGIKANRVIAVSFALSGLLAGTAAILLTAQTGTVYSTVGSTPTLIAFVATIIGGIGSLRGAVLGGFLLGAVAVALQAYLPADIRPYRDAFAYTVVIALLVFRPQGLVPTGSRVRSV